MMVVRRRTTIIASLILLLFSGLGIYLQVHKAPSPIPKVVASVADYPLYYTYKLPKGFTVDRKSFLAREGAVIFTVNTPSGQPVYVSEQPQPGSDFDFNKFYRDSLASDNPVAVTVGTATVGLIKESSFASLPLDKTWIILHAKTRLSDSEMITILNSLRPVPNSP